MTHLSWRLPNIRKWDEVDLNHSMLVSCGDLSTWSRWLYLVYHIHISESRPTIHEPLFHKRNKAAVNAIMSTETEVLRLPLAALTGMGLIVGVGLVTVPFPPPPALLLPLT